MGLLNVPLLAVTMGTMGFGQGAPNVVVLDGMLGVANHRLSYPGHSTRPEHETRFGAIGNAPFSRLGYHRFFGPFSAGLGLGYVYSDRSPVYGDRAHVVTISPRFGWSFDLSKRTAIWIRAGATMLFVSSDQPQFDVSKRSIAALSIDLEPMFVFRPARHFGVTFGPGGSFGVAGALREERTPGGSVAFPVRIRMLSVSLGFLVDF